MPKRLILPLPPTINHSHGNINKNGRLMRIRSNATKAFCTEAGWLAKIWKRETGWNVPDTFEKVIVRIWVYWPDKRKRDSDNLLKLTLDSLSGVLYEDDRQVLPRVMDFAVDKENPRIELELSCDNEPVCENKEERSVQNAKTKQKRQKNSASPTSKRTIHYPAGSRCRV